MERPSVMRSTLSILAVFSVAVYALAAGLVAYATAFHGMPQAASVALMQPFEFLVITFGASYLTARGTDQPSKPSDPPTSAITVSTS